MSFKAVGEMVSLNAINLVNNIVVTGGPKTVEETLLLNSIFRLIKLEADMMLLVMEPHYEKARDERDRKIDQQLDELAQRISYTVDDERKHEEYLREFDEDENEPLE